MVVAPLAVVAAEKLPHYELPQVTLHLTPPLALSLLTMAVRFVVALVTIEDGGWVLKLTEMVTGGVLEPPPPQPVMRIKRTTRETKQEKRRVFIAHLRKYALIAAMDQA